MIPISPQTCTSFDLPFPLLFNGFDYTSSHMVSWRRQTDTVDFFPLIDSLKIYTLEKSIIVKETTIWVYIILPS